MLSRRSRSGRQCCESVQIFFGIIQGWTCAWTSVPSLYYARHPRRLDMTDGYVTKHPEWRTPERPLIMFLSTADTGICQAADLQARKRDRSALERRRRQSPSHKDRISDLVIFQPRSKFQIPHCSHLRQQSSKFKAAMRSAAASGSLDKIHRALQVEKEIRIRGSPIIPRLFDTYCAHGWIELQPFHTFSYLLIPSCTCFGQISLFVKYGSQILNLNWSDFISTTNNQCARAAF